MPKKLHSYFEALSIRRKMTYIILGFVLILLIFFSLIFRVMMSDLREAAVSRNAEALSLIMTDLSNYESTLESLSTHIIKNDYVKQYASSSASEADKTALQSQMSRNTFKENYFNFSASNTGVSGFAIAKSADDYTFANANEVHDTAFYDRLVSYVISEHPSMGGNAYMALPDDLYREANFLCYVMPIADPDRQTIETGGYFILFVSRYGITKIMARYQAAGTGVSIVDSRGNPILESGALHSRPGIEDLRTLKDREIRILKDSDRILLAGRLTNTDWFVFYETPTAPIDAQMRKYQIMTAFMAAAIVLVALLMIRAISASFTRRITEMTTVMADVRSGNMDSRYPVRYHDEISLIGEEFNRMIDEIQNYGLTMAVRDLREREASLRALQSNISPHFLYNSLDCIRTSALLANDQAAAKQIQLLADMFRYVTTADVSKRETVTIRQEMKHVGDYLALLRYRFQDRYTVNIQVADEILPLCILKLVLQPVIENSFQHGIRHLAEGGVVNVLGWAEHGRVVIFKISDNGAGIAVEELHRLRALLQEDPLTERENTFMGLLNINDRIRIAYGNEYGVSVESELHKGTEITIRLPYLKNTEEK